MFRTTESEAARSKETEKVDSRETLKRIHEEITEIRTADKDLTAEMSKFTIVCEPPPITPRCHPQDLPPNPYLVNIAMGSMNSSRSDLQKEIENLRPAVPNQNKKFEEHFGTLEIQMQNLGTELRRLDELTRDNSQGSVFGDPDYNKTAILQETKKIDAISKAMDKTRKQLEKDLH